jgi:hypothetical protein
MILEKLLLWWFFENPRLFLTLLKVLQDEKQKADNSKTSNTFIKACKVNLFRQICKYLIFTPKIPS